MAVRGAVSVSEDTEQAIQSSVAELLEALIDRNQIRVHEIVTVIFTMTPDLTALNPAKAARLACQDWDTVPLLCAQEPVVKGMLPRCIRVLIQWQAMTPDQPVVPVYLGDAQQLRPELG